jgi:hypothetical protein
LKYVNLQLGRSDHKVSGKIAITVAGLDAAFASSLTRASAGANSPGVLVCLIQGSTSGKYEAQARHMLASVYDRFTEGFVTADLKLAHALLEDLR